MAFFVDSPLTLSHLLAGFVRRHWRAYLASGAMLFGVAVLSVAVPRQVGLVIDDLAAGSRDAATLWPDVLLIVAMGLIVMLIVLAVLMPIIELNQLVK